MVSIFFRVMVLWGYNDSKRPHHGHEKCSSSTSPLLWLGTWRPCTRLRELFHVKKKKRKQKQNCLLCMLMRSVHNTHASIPICRQLLTLPSWKYIWTFFDVSTLIGNLVSSIWLSLKAFISSAFFVILLCVCVSVILIPVRKILPLCEMLLLLPLLSQRYIAHLEIVIIFLKSYTVQIRRWWSEPNFLNQETQFGPSLGA